MPAVVASTAWAAVPEASAAGLPLAGTLPADCQLLPPLEVHSVMPALLSQVSSSSWAGPAASWAAAGMPLACALLGLQGAVLATVQLPPETGPDSSVPAGLSR